MNKQKIENLIKWALGIILIGLGGFASLFLIKSIVTLAIVLVGGLALYNFVPLIARSFAHLNIMGNVTLARINPVPELQLQYQKKHEIIEKAAESITALATETKNYKDRLEAFMQKRPEKAESFKGTYNTMVKVLNMQKTKLSQSRAELEKFQDVIIEAEDIWSMTQAAQQANKALKKFNAPDPMDEIRQRTALDSIMSSLNQVTSELETAVSLDYKNLDEETLLKLNDNSSVTGQTIDVKVKEIQNVSNNR